MRKGRSRAPFLLYFVIRYFSLHADPVHPVPHSNAIDGVPLLQAIDDIHPRHHLAEHRIAAIEMRLRCVRDEELAAACVGTVESHVADAATVGTLVYLVSYGLYR